ncbi:MAG: hypothetical protein AABY22_33260 [Nanoarchaeota archaeon]
MKTFIFNETNGNASITLSATDYTDALEYLKAIVASDWAWRCEDEEGEEE